MDAPLVSAAVNPIVEQLTGQKPGWNWKTSQGIGKIQEVLASSYFY
jgi:hypothetical protein